MPKLLYWNCTAPGAGDPGTVVVRKLELISEICALTTPDIICLDEIAGDSLRDYGKFLDGYIHLEFSENEGVHLNGATFCTFALKKGRSSEGLSPDWIKTWPDDVRFQAGVGLPNDPRFQVTFTTQKRGEQFRIKRDLLFVKLPLDPTNYLRVWFIHANANEWNGRFACTLCREFARRSGSGKSENTDKPNILEVFLGDFNFSCPAEVECVGPLQSKFPGFTNWKKVADDGTLGERLKWDSKLNVLKMHNQLPLYFYSYDVKDFLVAPVPRLIVSGEDIVRKLRPERLRDIFSFSDHFPIVFNVDLRRPGGLKRARDEESNEGPREDPEARRSKRLRGTDPTPGTPLANGDAATPRDAVK